jgi:hypothetical protein
MEEEEEEEEEWGGEVGLKAGDWGLDRLLQLT